jgi:pyruvate dehydrogenase E2 component (dihydrolipoamide acetyltransferase)
VGSELAEIDDGSEGQQKAEVSAEAAEERAEPKEAEANATVEPEEPEPRPAEPSPQPIQREPAAAPTQAPERVMAPQGDGGPRSQILSPLVRKLAEEHDIDLSRLQGTGTGGRITKRDVMAHVEQGDAASREAAALPAAPAEPAPTMAAPAAEAAPQAPAPAVRPPQGEREQAVPMTHIRKAIAKHMVASLQTSARAWNLVEVDMEPIARLRDRAKDAFRAREGFGLTFMPFVARAVCDALLAFPDVNGELRDEDIVLKRYVNLGIAVAYEEGLIVPVVQDADQLNLAGVARAINDVAVRARSKKLKPDEVHGGTFTITNPGPFGSIISVPIINQPQTAILAFDAVEKRPVVIDDAIAIRHMVYLSMSWDHRVIDGATAAKFLARLKQNLETWDFTHEVQGYLDA